MISENKMDKYRNNKNKHHLLKRYLQENKNQTLDYKEFRI
jgi:hypothetical protein